jgi:hypothetical protein
MPGCHSIGSIGRPASFGCIRMRSRDVANLFASIKVGTKIAVLNQHLGAAIAVAANSLGWQARNRL